MKVNSTFLLSGGAGRIITAIPALEKYARLNPGDDFKVLVYQWDNLYWNHPLLQSKTYSAGQKGMFELIIKKSQLISPEPYHRHSYYNQLTSLAEAFDEEINHTDDHSDLDKPNLYCNSTELLAASILVQQAKQAKSKRRFIVYQPYGSGIAMMDNQPYDSSGRSLNVDQALYLGQLLSRDAAVLYFGPNEFIHPKDDCLLNTLNMANIDIRFFMAIISQCDLFIGVDSVGQHIARAFNKPGLIIMGSTFEKNVTYPDFFKIYRNGIEPTYSPIRIGGLDCELADRANDNVMMFTKQQIEEIFQISRTL